jgi:hypothetical protein
MENGKLKMENNIFLPVETGRNGKKREYFKRHVYIVLRIRQEDCTE